MKLTITASDLRAALDVAAPSTSKSVHFPILQHVLCEADPETGLTVTGDTGDRQRAWRTVPAIVEASGRVALPPERLYDLVESVDGSATVEIAVAEGHKATLVSGRTRVRVPGLDPDDFPTGLVFSAPSWQWTLPGALLAQVVGSVAHALAPDDSRPVLAGVHLVVRDGALTLAAADGFRLAVRTIPAEGAAPVELVVSGKALVGAVRHLGGGSTVRLVAAASLGALLLESDAGSWAIRLIDGPFPDYRRIIPAETPIVVTAAKADLIRATRLIRNLTISETREGRTVRYAQARLVIDRDGLTVTARDGDQEAETQLAAELERGEGLEIRFNGVYFRDAVAAIESERVALELTDAGRPGIVREAGARNGHLQVVMPQLAVR